MANFELSELAKIDLQDIFKYGVAQWGLRQAETYYNALFDHLEIIAADPYRYPAVEHIKTDCHRSVFRSHAIYFQIDGDDVLIIGIIRSQDPARLR